MVSEGSLSQNRSADDVAGVIRALSASERESDRATADLMGRRAG